MQPVPTECRQREILDGRYRADWKVYVSALRVLNELGDVDRARFKQAYANGERARIAFEAARDLLEDHLNAHGCGKPD